MGMDISKKIFYLNREQEELHTQTRAKELGLPYISLTSYPLVKEILSIIPEEFAAKYEIIPYLKIGKDVKIGVTNPENPEMVEFLKQYSRDLNVVFRMSVVSNTSFLYGISMYERYKKSAFDEVNKQREKKEEIFNIDIKDIKSAAEAAKQASVTKLLDTLLVGAIKLNASDIHIEPAENDFLVRYRVDGVLQDVVSLPVASFKQIISRIKYLSALRMDLNDQPQDGRFSFSGPEELEIDFRVSIMPSAFGESVVMRLLGQEMAILKLDSLGFRPDALAAIREAIYKPHGMILTSGPTGSGKSSTLYAILTELNKPGVKIITLEDPIEYKIKGVEQSQVKPGAGYEFSDGLKASLRQDPDILMVGEIRDGETAEIAVQAALTGHLLLSTIHANSAPAVFARLLEIGVKPFLLSGSINIIMAQRLVRKLCVHCQEQYSPDTETWGTIKNSLSPLQTRLAPEIAAKLDQDRITLPKAKGCDKCNMTGFSGRQVIIEFLVPNVKTEELISHAASILEFEEESRREGMITMEQDGLIKVLEGTTTVEEVWRVTKS
jgi:type IV pilus assembly protein PilB